MSSHYTLRTEATHHRITLTSPDNTNKLTREKVLALTRLLREVTPLPIILTGNEHFFSAGADLKEIRALSGAEAFAFARMGQQLMAAVASFPAPVIAAIQGYCMGGGLDLALACHYRVCSPNAVFAHRGAALGIMTGWGGTQRLPRLVGKPRALELFLTGEKIHAERALSIGLVSEILKDPATALTRLAASPDTYPCTPANRNESPLTRPSAASPTDPET
ncbi:MAG: enoyl-CoA hydratase/isomerase family protein [Acidobacteriales bacterium]|nr:enoyl-CoA hydratase/isomerase family protein [Terriglobales bacterium]